MDEGSPRLLLEGRPGIGKTTVARRLLQLLQEADVAVGGFTTGELRTSGRREGFVVEAASGAREVLAHVGLPGPPRVGRYGVDLAALERVALSALGDPGLGGVVVVDELGKMELASAAFRAAVLELLGRDVAVVATVQLALEPVDLVVCGSVAVNRQGARVGIGGGFSDLESALLVEAGLIGLDAAKVAAIPALAARAPDRATQR